MKPNQILCQVVSSRSFSSVGAESLPCCNTTLFRPQLAAAFLLSLVTVACGPRHRVCNQTEVDSLRARTVGVVREVRKAYPEIGPAVVDTTKDPCGSGKVYQVNYGTEEQKGEIESIAARYPLLKGRVRYRNW